MAFWARANDKGAVAGSKPVPGPAKPLAVLLHSPSDFSTLVRLRVRLAGANQDENQVDDGDDDSSTLAAKAAAPLAQLHELIMAIEAKSADAAKLSITEVLEPPNTLQLLCQKVCMHPGSSLHQACRVALQANMIRIAGTRDTIYVATTYNNRRMPAS